MGAVQRTPVSGSQGRKRKKSCLPKRGEAPADQRGRGGGRVAISRTNSGAPIRWKNPPSRIPAGGLKRKEEPREG